jgi:hypothetical protein
MIREQVVAAGDGLVRIGPFVTFSPLPLCDFISRCVTGSGREVFMPESAAADPDVTLQRRWPFCSYVATGLGQLRVHAASEGAECGP